MQQSRLRLFIRFVFTWLILIGLFSGILWAATTYSPFGRCRHRNDGTISPLVLRQIDRAQLSESQRELLRLVESNALVGESRSTIRPLLGDLDNGMWNNGHECFSVSLPGIKDKARNQFTPTLLISIDSECDHVVSCSTSETAPGWGF